MELQQWNAFREESEKAEILSLVQVIVKKEDEGIDGTPIPLPSHSHRLGALSEGRGQVRPLLHQSD